MHNCILPADAGGSASPLYPRLAQHPVYACRAGCWLEYDRLRLFKSLADRWADTTTPHGRLLVTMLAGIAEFERELIRARTGEGRTLAKARGVRFGRPPVLCPSTPRSYPAPCGGRYAG
jgi:hypothetical protein